MTLVKERLGLEVSPKPGSKGQFEVIADGETIATRGGNWFTRSLGMGYPSPETVLKELERRVSEGALSGE